MDAVLKNKLENGIKDTNGFEDTGDVCPCSDSVIDNVGVELLQINTETCEREDDNEDIRFEGNRITGSRRWWVLACGFWSCFLADGFIFHLSIIFFELQDEFQKSKAETALVQSVASGTFSIGGIFAGIVTTRFGIFKSGLLGATLECFGLFTSFFATGLPYLVVSLGLVTGFGTSITYVFATTNIAFHWTGKGKLIAITIAHVGAGIGAITFPFIIDFLSRTYGWRGALLILSAIMSHIFIFALSFYSQLKPTVKQNRREIEIIRYENDMLKTPISTFATMLSIIKDKMFIIYIIASSFTLATCLTGLIIFVDYFQYKGFSRSSALYAYFYMSLTSVLARPLPGILKKIPHVSILDIQAFVSAVGAFSFGVFPFVSSFPEHVVLACMMGILLGSGVSLTSVCSMKLLGQKRFAIGSGMSMTVFGILTIIGGPTAGYVRDLTGKYDCVYYGCSALLFLSTCVCIGISLIRKSHRSKIYKRRNIQFTCQ